MSEHNEYSVAQWAKFFQVSRSGYYTHIGIRELRVEEKKAVMTMVKRLFNDSNNTYGPKRICGLLRKSGRKASYGKISKYMAEMKLQSVYNRHKTHSFTDSRKSRGEGYPNLVRDQLFHRPYQAVCSDVTYLKSAEGWLYMCMVKDIVSGEVLGEATGNNMKKELVIRAFLNAQARHKLKRETIFHSDRGSQYTSGEFMNLLNLYGMRQSFSRVGKPGDNAWAESFFATMKKECIHWNHFATKEEIRQTVFAWIHGFYNSRRVQARMGYASPREYSALLTKSLEMAVPVINVSQQPSNALA